jgi:hypothetical protein
MSLDLVAYAIVALAAGWTAWSLFLRRRVRQAMAKSVAQKSACGDDCACG